MPTGFKHNTKNNIEYLTIPMFEKSRTVRHCFSTRVGGVSKDGLSTLNLGFTRGDEPENVKENYRRILKVLGIDAKSIVLPAQTHTDNIRIVGFSDRGTGVIKEGFTDVDGLMTNERGVTLVTFYADCVPLFFLDKKRKAIALIHSGWRGTEMRIGAKAVDMLCKHYGSRPEDILAAIGPSAGPCCYEVSDSVAFRLGKVCGLECLELQKETGKYNVNLWLANKNILLQAGLQEENITLCEECTICNERFYFSHRRQGDERGSLAAIMALR